MPHTHQAFSMRKRQRLDENAVDHAKIDVVAPMLSAKVSKTVPVNPGVCTRRRKTCFKETMFLLRRRNA